MAGDNHCYFHSVSYLLTNNPNQHTHVRKQLCDYIEKEENFTKLRHLTDSKTGVEYINSSQMRLHKWATEIELHATAHMIGKDVICHYNGRWQIFAASGNAKKMSENAMYIINTGIHYNAVVGP